MGHGDVHEAIVFKQLVGDFGSIDILHCLASTKRSTGHGTIHKVELHTMEELVEMARKLAKV